LLKVKREHRRVSAWFQHLQLANALVSTITNITIQQGLHMKQFAFFTGFLLLTTAVAVPFFFKKGKTARQEADENIRYDINDYLAAEGL